MTERAPAVRDYIRFTGKTFEAEGRHALLALYGVLAARILVALVAIAAAAVLGPHAAVGLTSLVAGVAV